jgi:uncharacterized delta-60 repeat protein
MRFRLTALLAALVICGAERARGAAGDLDPGFGSGGIVTTNVRIDTELVGSTAHAVVAQADGRTVVVGDAFPDFALVRYLGDGSLDASFGLGGRVLTDFAHGIDVGRAALQQADGRLVAAGEARQGTLRQFALVRYLADGSLDASFGDGGQVLTPLGTDSAIAALAIAPDGALIAAGSAVVSGRSVFALARYLSDGSLDASFGIGGIVTTAVGPSDDRAVAVQRRPDGRIVVAGASLPSAAPAGDYDFAVAQYLADGTLDAGFGSAGKVVVALGSAADVPTSLVLGASGALTVAGSSRVPAANRDDVALLRLLADGNLDASFGVGGVVIADLVAARSELANAAVLAGDDVVIGGSVCDASDCRWYLLAAFAANGSLNPSFASQGVQVTGIAPNRRTEGLALARRSDGAILLAGVNATADSYRMTTLRYTASGVLDASFDGDGIAATSVGTDFEYAQAVAALPDGRLLVGGFSSAGFRLESTVLRYLPDGQLDPTYGTGGRAIHDAWLGDDWVEDMLLLPGGKLVLAGGALVRLNADGSLDTSFGTNGVASLPFGATALAQQPDGKLLVVSTVFNGPYEDFAITRRLANGAVDTSFGSGGQVIVGPGTIRDYAADVLVQPDGKILIGGAASTVWTYEFGIVRLLPNGSLDPGFGGGDGRVMVPVDGMTAELSALALQPDGKIVAAGRAAAPNSSWNFALARFNVDGSLDTSFGGGDGTQLTALSPYADRAIEVVVQADGRLIAVGFIERPGYTDGVLAARYLADGTLDASFSGDGIADVPSGYTAAFGATLQGDKLVVAGFAYDGFSHGEDFMVARYDLGAICGDGTLQPDEGCEPDSPSGDACCSAACVAASAATACDDDGLLCTGDHCDGAGGCVHPAGNLGVVCRAASAACDAAEACDGSSLTCPPDHLVAAGTICRSASDSCDVAESCDGASPTCPADQLAAAGWTCRAAVGVCDVAEHCDGLGAACPSDAVVASGATCRASTGVCDIAETCDGSGGACAPDAKRHDVCRAATGICDADELCDGVGNHCPADLARPDGSSCADALFCNGSETCQVGSCAAASPPCAACDEAGDLCIDFACPPVAPQCRSASAVRLQLRDDADDARDALRWLWSRGESTSVVELADPTTTADYVLCMYAAGGDLLPGGELRIAPDAARWSSRGARGYRYRDRSGSAGGIEKALLKPSARGRTKLQLQGAGSALPDPPLPLPLPLEVALINQQTGICWGARFETADVSRNDASEFRAQRRE